MLNSDYGYAAVSLVLLIVSNFLLARHWAEGGLFVRPVSGSVLSPLCGSLLMLCFYGIICLQSNTNVFDVLFYFLLAALVMPTAWGIIYRFFLMTPGLLQLNIALRRLEEFESSDDTGNSRSLEIEKTFRENKAVQRNIQLIRKSISFFCIERPVNILSGEVLLTPDHLDDYGYLTVECLCCQQPLKMFNYADDYDVECYCESKVYFVRNDDILLIKVKLKKPIILITNENRYYLAMANEMLAQTYMMMGELDQAKSYLDTARYYVGNLYQRFPTNKFYMELLSLVFFKKAKINFIQGDKANALSYARESLRLTQKLCDHEKIDIINSLILKC
jgi:hypothetical protein